VRYKLPQVCTRLCLDTRKCFSPLASQPQDNFGTWKMWCVIVLPLIEFNGWWKLLRISELYYVVVQLSHVLCH
jgi:hypothetical protein